MRRIAPLLLGTSLAACTAANPLFDAPGQSGGDTVAAETEAPSEGTTTRDATSGSADTRMEGSGESDGVTSDTVGATDEPPIDTGVEPSCQPEDPGRPLEVTVIDSSTGGCGPAIVSNSLFDLERIAETNAYSGRLCDRGCGALCPADGSDQYLTIELPADLGEALAQAPCIELEAGVDHGDGCRVDYMAIWIDGGMESKAPNLVGATVDAPSEIVGGLVLPQFQWIPFDTCGDGCGPDPAGTWALQLGNGTVFEHGKGGQVSLGWSGGAITDDYDLVNLRSFVTDDCQPQLDWVAVVL